MKITTETINYVAKLAKLKFTQQEADQFANEFEKIFTHFENLDKEDLTGIKLNEFNEVTSVLRKDEMKVFESKKELFQNVKKMRENHISIPKVIE
ncbi:Asp-tRNA(Asn)/Glu-tRNA(Gln) amidotransferase subunit GatC [Marinisporobacter balticus]|uniref:Aspartyl/glutamyl-tRNA(Asn/Gln) amidotransferase subunit C n=1 Tax=Marinisporobacter balticus TaxID=2018667 RepID=A0A4R2K6X7_9FIRM|nr:Asp-tRNA(Asn)/Glu-tRNA(Gln) amidotransferase subunit GatC [Marinisporobacter balticus]TCO69061.1 aspartyl/glutamyl-tRNA(Asn/Gln) amidotransferase subunit C [Marinisporobacter balticus]